MATYRVQHCFQGGSGSSKDKFCNTFHYTSAIPPDTIDVPSGNPYGSLIAGHVRNFYSTLEIWMSDEVNNPFRTISIYDEAAAANTPAAYSVTDSVVPFPSKAARVGMPEEVAVCLSYSALSTGAIVARRRGRLYIGPLTVAAIAGAAGELGPAHVHQEVIDALLAAAQTFKSDMSGDDATWSVYSKSDDAAHEVILASVDNAFDTMRKRGPDASAHTSATIT